jgi:protein tyrosine phosphatase
MNNHLRRRKYTLPMIWFPKPISPLRVNAKKEPPPQGAPSSSNGLPLQDICMKCLLEAGIKEDGPRQDTMLSFDELSSQYNDYNWPPLCSVAAQHEEKNRYTNIIPYDTNRYVMKNEELKEKIPYINASVMKTGDILTQGPLEKTVMDFWAMCWDSGAEFIVNNTECVEGGKKRCHEYWPTNASPSLNFDEIGLKIQFIDEEPLKDTEGNEILTIRTFQLTKEGKTKQITQYHIRNWIDNTSLYGGELNEKTLLAIIDVFDHVYKGNSPLIIHCSAGVSRSGAFYACYLLYQFAAKYPDVPKEHIRPESILKMLWDHDSGRREAVQTEDRFKLILAFFNLIYKELSTAGDGT